MASNISEFDRTISFGEAALQRIRAFRHPAHPTNYEFWFTYATGFNAGLNDAVNKIISAGRAVTPEEADTLYQIHIAPSHLSQKVDKMGAMIVDEISQVMAMIDAARGSASAYDQSLNGLEESLGRIDQDRDQVRLIIGALIQATREIQHANDELEQRMVETRQEILALQLNLEAIRAEAMTDPLTQISNRKYFDAALEKMLAEARRGERGFSMLMIDIDHFKSFNDTYGHLVGDQVLRAVATGLQNNTKGQDVAARYGGEEFAILLPDTPLRSAVTLADNIRRTISAKELLRQTTGERLGRLTISVGVATYHDDDTAQALLERGDHCLYAAKRSGRNRVISETDPEAVMHISDQELL
ncbi:GGDEF domain-containing protein [Agaricicola taiwanensis]|nr:GGDEF domain-containing protein [Agaricicola taiwanensis]